MAKSADAFRTISEVADWLGVPTHVLRFWESKFPQVKPVKRAGGRRYYRPSDMLLLAGIRVLLHDDGVTIRGVQKVLREKGVKHVTGLADREVSETDDTPDQPTPETPDIEDANIVDLPRQDPAPQVIVNPPEPVAVQPENANSETVLEVESNQMALFSRSERAKPEPEIEEAPAAKAAQDPPAEPSFDLPGPSPVSTASLARLRALTNLSGDATAADLRAALAQQRGSLQALRDRLATPPEDTGSGSDA